MPGIHLSAEEILYILRSYLIWEEQQQGILQRSELLQSNEDFAVAAHLPEREITDKTINNT